MPVEVLTKKEDKALKKKICENKTGKCLHCVSIRPKIFLMNPKRHLHQLMYLWGKSVFNYRACVNLQVIVFMQK